MFCANKKKFAAAAEKNGLAVLYEKKNTAVLYVKKKKNSADSNRAERSVCKIYVKTAKPKIFKLNKSSAVVL